MPTPTMWRELVELLAPGRCPGCDLPEPGGQFCAGCAPLLEPPPRWLRPPAPCAAVHLYAGPLADALRRLKYAGRTDGAAALGGLLAGAALCHAGVVRGVVPMPLHPARLRVRGYNQAALLCRPVARALGVPLLCEGLRRVRPTAEQAGLPRAQRLDNVRGAFAVRGRLPVGPLLLVDDVRTTGATLAAAAMALGEAGAGPVRTLALAQADV